MTVGEHPVSLCFDIGGKKDGGRYVAVLPPYPLSKPLALRGPVALQKQN